MKIKEVGPRGGASLAFALGNGDNETCCKCSSTKLQESNVFTDVYLSFCSGVGLHVTITLDAVNLTVQTSLQSPDAGPTPLLVKYGGQDCKPVQAWSLEAPPPPSDA